MFIIRHEIHSIQLYSIRSLSKEITLTILSDHLNIHYRSYMQRYLYLLLCSLVLVFTFIVFIPFSCDAAVVDIVIESEIWR